MALRSTRRSTSFVLVLVLVVLERSASATDTNSILSNPFAGNADAIKEGTDMYRGYCTGCHGGLGHGGKCPDITDDIWIHGGSDAEVFRTIGKGVPGTEMRNFDVGLRPDEIWKIIAYIRTLAVAGGESAWKKYEDGDSARGKALFFDRKGMAQCWRCHMIHGEGGRLGPDLSRIAAKRTPEYIWESIVKPSADLVEGYHQIVVILENGREYEGYARNEDNFSLQMITTEEKIISLDKMEVASVTTNKGSAMLGNYQELLTERGLHDLMAYLRTLTGKP
jgi:putative heme-binding domain-containing protein